MNAAKEALEVYIKKKKKKRSIEISNIELEPVMKKPKISQFTFNIKSMNIPKNYKTCIARDIAWTISCSTDRNVPMWSGWNSKITRDDLPSQKVGYMANIGAPPTQHDVVLETLKRNVSLAEECNEKYILTTYDLAIAKPASQIREILQPRFDNVFICFGAFHIMFCYLSLAGYLMDGSGTAHILIERGALSEGSFNAFLKGKKL